MKFPSLTSALEWTMRILMAAALLAMMILTFVDVIGRYAFNAPIFGTSEMISYLLAILLFAGLALVSGERGHITITILEGWMDRRVGRARRWFIHAFCLAAMALVAVELFRHGLRMIHDQKATIVLEWSLWPLTMAMAAMAAAGFVLLLAAKGNRSRRPAAPDDGSPP
jgi:TRAP-type C4-dicarboxylate transport system permease small subunit